MTKQSHRQDFQYFDVSIDVMDLENYDLEIIYEPVIKYKESMLFCGSFRESDFVELPPLGQINNVYIYKSDKIDKSDTETDEVPTILSDEILGKVDSNKHNAKLDDYVYFPKRPRKNKKIKSGKNKNGKCKIC